MKKVFFAWVMTSIFILSGSAEAARMGRVLPRFMAAVAVSAALPSCEIVALPAYVALKLPGDTLKAIGRGEQLAAHGRKVPIHEGASHRGDYFDSRELSGGKVVKVNLMHDPENQLYGLTYAEVVVVDLAGNYQTFQKEMKHEYPTGGQSLPGNYSVTLEGFDGKIWIHHTQ